MRRPRRALRVGLAVLVAFAAPVILLVTVGWPTSTRATTPAQLGVSRSARELEEILERPGPITVETVVGADWTIERSGLIDLDDPRAAALEDGMEPIHIYFHALRHPTEGLYLVDTGVERAFAHDPDRAALRGLIAKAAGADRIRVVTDTATWIAAQEAPVRGVLLTHLHLDHVTGLRDVTEGAPVYTGPGESASRSALAFFTQASVDRALEGRPAVREWRFEPDPSGSFDALIDVFGDGSLWAISSPGHTAGSTAFLARTPEGPVLMTGDVCHTAWGWQHGVAPGAFTEDHAANAESLERLRALVERHPSIDVRLGHQELPRAE